VSTPAAGTRIAAAGHASGLLFCWLGSRPIHPQSSPTGASSIFARLACPGPGCRHQAQYATAALKPGVHSKIVNERMGHCPVTFTLQPTGWPPARRAPVRPAPRPSPRPGTAYRLGDIAKPLVDEAIDQDPRVPPRGFRCFRPGRAAAISPDPDLHRRDHPPSPGADRLAPRTRGGTSHPRRRPPTVPMRNYAAPANAPTPSSRPGASWANSAAGPGVPGNWPRPSTSSGPRDKGMKKAH
jgi:hypothetical protein